MRGRLDCLAGKAARSGERRSGLVWQRKELPAVPLTHASRASEDPEERLIEHIPVRSEARGETVHSDGSS